MAAKFASLTALLLLGTVANVAEPVFARAIEGRQVVSSVATVPAGTTAVPSSVNFSTVSICTHPVTATVSSALPSTTVTSNLTANGTAVSEPSTTVASNVSASSFFSFNEPAESSTGVTHGVCGHDCCHQRRELVLILRWAAATYTPILESAPTGSPANFTTIENIDTVTATVSSVFTSASPSGEPTASVVTVYYDCRANATAPVAPTSTAVAASSSVNVTSVEVTATAVPNVSNLFKRK
ncbi:hypothetical protein EWM64_g10093 [Hericium alpestre]|uniref:Uncharacterized protein n=1 Tax=Hericium alpestre TaxID=135208 RepID=A0A4Y9ZKG2_9AGAM|nr:hypothetical protein EWM64_g10093 [Hericium alpestre]